MQRVRQLAALMGGQLRCAGLNNCSAALYSTLAPDGRGPRALGRARNFAAPTRRLQSRRNEINRRHAAGKRDRVIMLIRSRETKARTDDTGDRPTVFQVAWIRPIAGFCCDLAVLTIFWRDWIESLIGYDPDQHDGTVECLIAIALLSSAPYWCSRRAPNGADHGPRLSSSSD